MCPSVDSQCSPNPQIFVGDGMILLREMPAASKMLTRIRLSEDPVSTRALLPWTSLMLADKYKGLVWSMYSACMSSFVNEVVRKA